MGIGSRGAVLPPSSAVLASGRVSLHCSSARRRPASPLHLHLLANLPPWPPVHWGRGPRKPLATSPPPGSAPPLPLAAPLARGDGDAQPEQTGQTGAKRDVFPATDPTRGALALQNWCANTVRQEQELATRATTFRPILSDEAPYPPLISLMPSNPHASFAFCRLLALAEVSRGGVNTQSSQVIWGLVADVTCPVALWPR